MMVVTIAGHVATTTPTTSTTRSVLRAFFFLWGVVSVVVVEGRPIVRNIRSTHGMSEYCSLVYCIVVCSMIETTC